VSRPPVLICCLVLGLLCCAAAPGMDYCAVFTAPPQNVPTYYMPDGPLLGNGDVGVVLAGPPEEQRFYLGKNDWWGYGDGSGAMPGGGLTLAIAELKGASYRQEQSLATAEVRGAFAKDDTAVQTRSFVDAGSNLLVTEVKCTGKTPVTAVVSQKTGLQDPWGVRRTIADDVLCCTRVSGDAPPEKRRDLAVATRALGGAVTADQNAGTLRITLKPGEVAVVVSAVLSKLDDPDLLAAAKKRVLSLAAHDIPLLSAKHRQWWKDFWARSFIDIPDKEIERRWYAALYVLGSCSRPGKIAPGLWGCWVTLYAQWHGDYHLNYNFQAPYYLAYSSNHADLSAPFYQAILAAMPRAKAMAKKHGWKGVHFPVCIGPWGILPEGEQDHGQRSNAAYAALNFIWQYQYTQDREFLAETAYPYLLEVADFWEDYLKLDGGRYVIRGDAIHEGSGDNMNPILSLGLLRTLFKNLIAMSKDLGRDEARRAKWQDILDRLSEFPLQQRNGKTVFRLTEKGMDWATGNTLEIQHIFPAGAIGLDSDPKLLQVCRHTIDEMGRWTDNNGFSSWYTVCARIGYDPKTILAKLREECDKHSLANLLLFYGGGGVESCGGFLAINEMLLQSHDGVIRLFPCWPKDQDARFGTLRAVGAFLVSAELKRGSIRGVTFVSEKGKACTMQNPWPGKTVRLVRNGKPAESVAGERFTLGTTAGEVIEFKPE
jgi:alpha-L-fucosidase 2